MELSEIEVIGRDVPLQLKERMEVNDKDNEKEKEKEKEKTMMTGNLFLYDYSATCFACMGMTEEAPLRSSSLSRAWIGELLNHTYILCLSLTEW